MATIYLGSSRLLTSFLNAMIRWSFIFALCFGLAQAGVQFAYSDHLGSMGIETNEEGEPQQLQSYFPFGEVLTPHLSSSPQRGEERGEGATPYLYTGQELDRASELYYYGARYYDPTLSRFTSTDPVFDSPSPYAYVNNNPIRLVDPQGRLPSDVIKDLIFHSDRGGNNTFTYALLFIQTHKTNPKSVSEERAREVVQKEIRIAYEDIEKVEAMLGGSLDDEKLLQRVASKIPEEHERKVFLRSARNMGAIKEKGFVAALQGLGRASEEELRFVNSVASNFETGLRSSMRLSAQLGGVAIEIKMVEIGMNQASERMGNPVEQERAGEVFRGGVEDPLGSASQGVRNALMPIRVLGGEQDYEEFERWLQGVKQWWNAEPEGEE